MGEQALAHIHPPNLQQVVQGINNVVAPATREPVAADIPAVLAFTIPAGQVIRRIFWSANKVTVAAGKTKVLWLWPIVPQSETRRYLHIFVAEPRVTPAITLSVLYPKQGAIFTEVGGEIAGGDTNAQLPDLLSPGQDSTKSVYPGLPVDVFPSGRLRGETLDPLLENDVVTVLTVWERLAPPNTAQAEEDDVTFIQV